MDVLPNLWQLRRYLIAKITDHIFTPFFERLGVAVEVGHPRNFCINRVRNIVGVISPIVTKSRLSVSTNEAGSIEK